ncbi:hypothetical protein V8D89_013169 [Ganoderma adspersum]
MAHVMQYGSAQFSGTYIPTVAGWVQAPAFHSSVPFNSKPPPVPAGVNPQTWQTGQWVINPYFRPQPGISQAQPVWAPHGWGPAVPQAQAQAHQPQANYNPHKRIPNPGDATYWATRLSDNPLGLENMHIKDPVPTTERHVKEQNGVPHTPWVWVPKELTTEEVNRSADSSTNPPSQSNQSQPPQPEKALPPPPQFSSSRDHARATSASQSTYPNPYPPSSSRPRLPQQVHTPAPPSASAAVSSYPQRNQDVRLPDRLTSASSQLQQQQVPQQVQEVDGAQPARQHNHGLSRFAGEPQLHRDYRISSTPASSSASAAAAARERERTLSGGHERTLDRSNEAYSQSREMHLTFSPKIIRTPDHYSSPSNSRHASQEDDGPTLPRTPVPHGNIYAPSQSTPSRPTPSRSNSMSTYRQSTTPSTPSTSGQTTPSSSLGFLTFTEEPQALLSPLVVGSTPPMETKPSPSRDVSRSQSYPFVRNPNPSVGFTGELEREGKVYPRTPRPHENLRSRIEPVEQGYHHSPDRDRSANATPQPSTRTPPKRTPPSRTSPSYNARPSPEASSHHARQISRSHTYPSVIPHGAAISPPVIPPPVIPSPVGSPPSNSMSTSPHYGSSHYSSSSSQGQQYPPSSRSSYSSSSYSRTSPNANSTRSRAASPLRHNPLPRPPAVSPYAESLTRGGGSSASAAAAAHQQNSYHNQTKRMVRRGYWNRRGDYLYVTDKDERFIVYAPPPLANPEELKQYPSPTDGWLDHHRDFIKYDPKVPELLDSLPVHGAAAKRPYQFVSAYNILVCLFSGGTKRILCPVCTVHRSLTLDSANDLSFLWFPDMWTQIPCFLHLSPLSCCLSVNVLSLCSTIGFHIQFQYDQHSHCIPCTNHS